MRRLARKGPTLAIILGLSYLLTACSGLSVPSPLRAWIGADERQKPQTVRLSLLSWSGSAEENSLLQSQLNAYRQEHPDVHIDQKLSTDYGADLPAALAADEPPDMVMLSGFQLPDLVASKNLSPITGPAATDGDVYATVRPGFGVGETIYCYPHAVDTLVLAYNKERFDKVGVAYPNTNWTWSDFSQAAAKLTDANHDLYGLVLGADFSRWLPFLYQAGGRVFDPQSMTMTLDTPAAATAMTYYLKLFQDGDAVQPIDINSSWAGEGFGKGQIAMTIEGNWLIPYLAAQFPELKYGITELPAGPAGKATVAFTSCLGVLAGSAQREQAMKVAAYLTRAESLLAWANISGDLPPTVSLGQAWLADRRKGRHLSTA